MNTNDIFWYTMAIGIIIPAIVLLWHKVFETGIKTAAKIATFYKKKSK